MTGCIIVDKPQGVTSNDVVVKVKKLLNLKKVGHLGTLDPLATGVLPICIGKATRLFDFFLKKTKSYIAKFKFGEQTFSLDKESQVEKFCDYIPTISQIENAIKLNFLGEIEQVPPIYSSKKVNGKRAYELARENKEVLLKKCKVKIYEYKILRQIDSSTFEFFITCSSGTYIRSLARDLGLATNSLATMVDLRRIKCGNFDLENSISYQDLTKEHIEKHILSLEQVLSDYDTINITNEIYQKIRNGINMPVNCSYKNDKIYVIKCDNEVCGLGKFFDNKLKITTYLK